MILQSTELRKAAWLLLVPSKVELTKDTLLEAALLLAQESFRQMVLMVGSPASGKGFFAGEPEVDKSTGKVVKPAGHNLDKSTGGLLKTDPSEDVESEESDAHLRALQFETAALHYQILKRAHEKGRDHYDTALKDHWYLTKDGKRRSLGEEISYENFPKSLEEFVSNPKSNDFYVSMRGWHDDAVKTHESGPRVGRKVERFKDAARELFDKHVQHKTGQSGANTFVVDSAGEDIDAQDFEAQIKQAKANGWNVSIIFLDVPKREIELSNLQRGFVNRKRMVDQSDIDNYYEKVDEGRKRLQKIAKAASANFLNFHKTPLSDEEYEKIHSELTKYKSKDIHNIGDLEPRCPKCAEEVKRAAKQIYKHAYQLNTETSFTAHGEKMDKPFVSPANELGAKSKTEQPELKKPNPNLPAKPRDKAREEKDLTPDLFRKKYGKCPQGYNWSGRTCRETEYSKEKPSMTAVAVGEHYGRKLRKSIQQGAIDAVIKKFPSKLEGYKYSAENSDGPYVYVKVFDAVGDTTAARKIKYGILPLVQKSLGKWPVTVSLRASNQGKDLVIEIEFMFFSEKKD